MSPTPIEGRLERVALVGMRNLRRGVIALALAATPVLMPAVASAHNEPAIPTSGPSVADGSSSTPAYAGGRPSGTAPQGAASPFPRGGSPSPLPSRPQPVRPHVVQQPRAVRHLQVAQQPQAVQQRQSVPVPAAPESAATSPPIPTHAAPQPQAHPRLPNRGVSRPAARHGRAPAPLPRPLTARAERWWRGLTATPGPRAADVRARSVSTSSHDGGGLGWYWAVLGALLVAVGAGAAFGLARRRAPRRQLDASPLHPSLPPDAFEAELQEMLVEHRAAQLRRERCDPAELR